MEKSTYGTAQFKVKYRTLELQVAPSATASSLGTLKKGAVITVIADEGRYYYKVRLGNGLEGYVYKPAGELIGIFTPAPAPVESSNGKKEPKEVKKTKGTSINNSTPPTLALEKSRTVPKNRTTTTRNGTGSTPFAGSSNSEVTSTSISSSGVTGANSGNGVKIPSSDAKDVTITSAEIAVFDKPGLTGKQVSKLKRGEQVTVLGQDGFFFEVLLSSGAVGYIPRYAGRLN